jgi:hypothetical protein
MNEAEAMELLAKVKKQKCVGYFGGYARKDCVAPRCLEPGFAGRHCEITTPQAVAALVDATTSKIT